MAALHPRPGAETHPAWQGYQFLDRSQWWPAADVAAWQLARLRELIAHCQRHVPYYRSALAGIDPADLRTPDDLRRLPTLDRRTYQERFPEFHAEALPDGDAPAGTLSTSGTSGTPVTVLTTRVVGRVWLACYLRELAWAGVDPTGTLAAVRPLGQTPAGPAEVRQPFWNPVLTQVIATGPAFGLDVHVPLDRQLAWLRQVNPDYLLSYPSNLDALAGLVAGAGRPVPNLKCVLTVAEAVPDDLKARVEAAFGVPVVNTYSCYEAGYVAVTCPAGHGLPAFAENA